MADRQPAVLAKRFVDLLMEEIGPRNFVQVLHRNASSEYGHGSCASHDFCDANMVMFAAWEGLGYGDMDAASDQDAATWNAAWEIAKRDYLTLTKH